MSRAPSIDPAQPPLPETEASADTVTNDDGEVIRFDCVDAHSCAETLLEHCKHVVAECSRIEMNLEDGSQVVLISKCELDSLEQAIEMYGTMTDGATLHERMRGLADCMQKELLTDGPTKADGDAN